MVNLYSAIKESSVFPKFEINDLLFVEYTCMQEENKFGIWSHNNYFAFISSGKKMWKSIYHSYEVDEGDIIFVNGRCLRMKKNVFETMDLNLLRVFATKVEQLVLGEIIAQQIENKTHLPVERREVRGGARRTPRE